VQRNISGMQTVPRSIGFFTALRRYGQIISALLQREQERRRQAPLEGILDVLEPVVFIGLMSILWTVMSRRNNSPVGDSAILFVATGFYAKFFWICLAKVRKGELGSPRKRFPVERRLDYAFVLVIITTIDYAILGFVGFGIIYIFVTPTALPYDFLAVIEGMVAIIMLGFGWGMISLTITRFFWPWVYFTAVFNRGLSLFSGLFFLIETLPPDLRYYLSLNPMYHAIALFRTGFYSNYPKGSLDTTYLAFWAIFAVLIGLVLERVTVRAEEE